MHNVKCIGNEFYSISDSATILFPALKELTLEYMDGLEEWMVPGGEGDQVFSSLEKLSIQQCGKLLRQLPTLGCLQKAITPPTKKHVIFNHLSSGPVVKAWDQEICSLCGLRFEPCGCSYDGHWRLTWSLTSGPVGLVEMRASWPGHSR